MRIPFAVLAGLDPKHAGFESSSAVDQSAFEQ